MEGQQGSLQVATSEGRAVPGCRARKSNSRVATSAPRCQVVPKGRARESHRRVTTARTGTVQNVLVGSECIRGSLRYWGGCVLTSEQPM